jgi:hypothetical protein
VPALDSQPCAARALQALLGHPSLLSVLARVLKEDGRRSLALAHSLVSCFACCALFTPLHDTVMQHQVRDTGAASQRKQAHGKHATEGGLHLQAA